MAEKKRSVGLVVLMDLPELGRVAVLQVRGEFDFEKMKPESWPGGCQVTVHGKLEESENWEEALVREAEEEMGVILSDEVNAVRVIDYLQPLIVVADKEKEVRTYALLLNASILAHLRLHASSGGIRFVTEAQANEIRDLATFEKRRWIPQHVTAMFPDERAAVLKAFEHFRATPLES